MCRTTTLLPAAANSSHKQAALQNQLWVKASELMMIIYFKFARIYIICADTLFLSPAHCSASTPLKTSFAHKQPVIKFAVYVQGTLKLCIHSSM